MVRLVEYMHCIKLCFIICVSLQNNRTCFSIVGEILNLERSETMPLIEKRTQENEGRIENKTGCKPDLNEGFKVSDESSINEYPRDK